ncbi:Kiwa anti-phage protein KwaB-like domain-containing protein [Thorsellia kenyensis]|uniref:Kiwa anti-phage protein KwaB-like domain-containing protein n=1 Tax=Thorsellia kenyensis TaxID=1549888 RepID=A0ABV6C977_9GAMM
MQKKLKLLERIKATKFEELECRLWVIKKNSRNGQNTYRALYAEIDGLDTDLKNVLKTFFNGNGGIISPINNLYTYAVLTSDLDEDQALIDSKANTDFATIIEKIENGADNSPVIKIEEFNDAWALIFEFKNDEHKFYGFSKVKGGWKLKSAKKIKRVIFNEGQFKKLEIDNIFSFRDSIDFVAVGEDVFIRDKANYELGLNIREGLIAKRDLLVDAFHKNGIIASVDDLKLAIGTNKTLLRRLVATEQKRNFEDKNFIELMRSAISEHNFDLNDNGNGQFVINENNVDLFLKLVNDKRFISLIKKEMVDADVVTPVNNANE